MEELLSLLIVMIGLGAWLVSIFVAVFLSNRRIWISVILGVLGGICFGIYMIRLPSGLFLGVIIGIIFNIINTSSGLLSKYYRDKGRKMLRKR
jgi:hypothetical protein